ncbi:RNA polymerase sigma-70 factor [Fulvivirga sp. M361]|uniref:RNA polymerase sigma-70 factor n=1 Tax=Fulvivirga sp. M361 TaxID=2594266 RepID=UPI0016265C69|nr:RNA polymerase sigma-70 factor [Fulvivirga sp. M361]
MKKEVVLKLNKGDESALKAIFDEYFEPLVQYSYAYIGDKEAAKDVVQQFYISLWKNRENLSPDTFESYLFISVRNRSVNYLRDTKKWVRMDQVPQEMSSDAEEFHQTEAHKIIQSYVQSGIARLPKKCKRIFLLSKADGLTYAEVADELDISVKTVERQMGIALKKLRTYMSDYLIP